MANKKTSTQTTVSDLVGEAADDKQATESSEKKEEPVSSAAPVAEQPTQRKIHVSDDDNEIRRATIK